MSTVAQVIDRAYREFLYPPDEQPARFTLAASIATTSVTSFTIDSSLLSAEEEGLFGPGTVVEIGRELIQIGAYDADTGVASSCLRGLNNTTEATHDSGAEGVLAPKYSRQACFDVLCDEVEALYPDLAKVTETESMVFSSNSPTEVAATIADPMYAWARPSGTTDWAEYDVRFLDHFPGSSASPTGKAVMIDDLPDSVTGYLVYRARFTRPTAESDSLATCGLEDEWERIAMLGMVSYLVAGKELSPLEQQFLSDQLAAQGTPVGSAARVWASLRALREDLLEKAKKAQRSRERPTVVRRSVY